MYRFYFLLLVLNISMSLSAQTDPQDFYYQIPEAPSSYNAATVAVRLLDGLGFRYYWASADLSESDLMYKPSEDGRTVDATLDHILGLTRTVANTAQQVPTGSQPDITLTYQEKRTQTLKNVQTASEALRAFNDNDLTEYPVVFERGERRNEFPFWNLINGPIADALWHVGQVVTMRRSAGNPIRQGISVFNGTVRD